MLRALFVFLVMLMGSTSARAEWHESSSAHFVIYADQSPEEIRKFSERLERFHNAVSFKLGLPLDEKISPSNRVTIYALRDISRVQKLIGDKKKQVAGIYMPRAGGSVAFIPEVDVTGKVADFSESVLLHEYTHHLMYSASSGSYPLWYSEGFAEFFAAAAFEKDGSVWLGRPAHHRFAEIQLAENVPIERLLDTKLYYEKRTKTYNNFYGRSWGLFHYLTYAENRKGQMSDYLARIRNNEGEIAAAKDAFGDLKILDKEFVRYLQQSSLPANIVKGAAIAAGPIGVRKLREGEAAIIPLRMQSKRGVDEEQAKKLLPEMQIISAKYATDPAVLAALSEAEYDAGNNEAAIAAADRALTANPAEINAYLQKGMAMARMAPDTEKPDQAWIAVRKHYVKMNSIENDHPLALRNYYDTYQEQGREPTKNAVEGLNWSLILAPFDGNLRMKVAAQEMSDKKYAAAILTLKPLAYSPHETPQSKTALELLEKAEAMLTTEKAPDVAAPVAAKTEATKTSS